MNDLFVLPSEIPWDQVKGKDLEELLYWLLDSMGAKDLEWRIGGKGSGAADQGRDLECSFYMSSPDGNLVKQKWWVEAKGRTATVESANVKEAVINASGESSIDIIVIATNTNFSNPTRDWIKEWQVSNPRLTVKLWERSELENLCSKNPLAVVRLFRKALSPHGKLEVARSKLWDYASFTDEPMLIELWESREKLNISPEALVALVSSEMANGDINNRSWAIFVEEDILVNSLGSGLLNFLYLVFRANEYGVSQASYFGAFAYLTLACCERIGTKETVSLFTDIWMADEENEYPEDLKNIILQPVLNLLQNQIRDVCTSDCCRVSTDNVLLTEKEVNQYWNRLSIGTNSNKEDDTTLTIESLIEPCKVGFSVGKDNGCPLLGNDSSESNIKETLEVIKAVTEFRLTEAKKE